MIKFMHFYQCTGLDAVSGVPFFRVFKHLSDMLVFVLTTEHIKISMYKVLVDVETMSVVNQHLTLDDVLKTIPD